jgi:plastocyanin
MFAKIHALALVRTVAIAVALTNSSAVGNAGPAAPRTANAVIIKNFDFAPMSLTVKAGMSVTWKNLDGEPHTVTSVDGLFRSGAIDENESFTFKFDKPGTYKYLCSIHPKMMAAIIVN